MPASCKRARYATRVMRVRFTRNHIGAGKALASKILSASAGQSRTNRVRNHCGHACAASPAGSPSRSARRSKAFTMQAFQFPQRNRIVAALSLGTLVVEAQYKSGALITARLATGAGREVFAIPGSIHNPMARGCHRLLRDGATLVESPGEIVAALAPLANAYADDLRIRLHVPTSPNDALQQSFTGMGVFGCATCS